MPEPPTSYPSPWSLQEPEHGYSVAVLDARGVLIASFPAQVRQVPAPHAVGLVRHVYDLTAAREAARLLVEAGNREEPTPCAR